MVLVLLVFVPELLAQTTTNEQTEPKPASAEDLQKITNEVKKLRTAEEKSTKQMEVDRKALQKKLNDVNDAQQKSSVDTKNLRDDIAPKVAAIPKAIEKANDRNIKIVIGLGALVSIIVLIGFTISFRKKTEVKTEIHNHVVEKIVETQSVTETKMLVDPEIPDLEAFSKANNWVTNFTTQLTLQDGRKYNCQAIKENGNWYALIEDDSQKVTWKNRRKRASLLPCLINA